MWFLNLLALVFPVISLGLKQDAINFSVNYFKERNVPFVCLVTCENLMWDVKFTKAISTHSMSVSRLNTNNVSYHNMKRCFRQYFNNIGVLMNAQCENTGQILNVASVNMWLDSSHIWLIIDESENLTNYQNLTVPLMNHEDSENSPRILQILGNLNISVDADIILALRNGDQFNLFDIFNFGKILGGSLVVTEAGRWKHTARNKDLWAGLNGCKYYKRWDFRQSAIRIISVTTLPAKDFDPKLLTDIQPVAGISTITRTSTMVLAAVAEIHNIKFVHTMTDRWLGKYDKNATRAVATALFFREQDLTSVLRMQISEFDKVTFILPTLTAIETRYYYRIPTTGPGKFENQFLRPLSFGAWCCLLATSVVCAVILTLAARLEARPSSAQYALFSVSASVCQQYFEDDTQVSRVSAARKLTIFITGISCVLIYNFYTSSVVSGLLNGPPPSINSLQELLESPLELIYQDVGYTRSWLNNDESSAVPRRTLLIKFYTSTATVIGKPDAYHQTPGYYFNRRNAKSEDDLRRKVLNKKKSRPIIKSLKEGIAMVKRGGYAYHTETYNADTLISQTFDQSELCELGSLTSMEKTRLYPGVQKNSPYKDFFTWSLTRLLERGVVSCIQRRTTPRPVKCEGSSPRALALGGAAPAFILLALGFLLATCIMLVERFIFKMKHIVK